MSRATSVLPAVRLLLLLPQRDQLKGLICCRRCWHQGSTDHRGTEKAPGRVVTMIQDPDSVCWGTAFLLAGSFEEQKKELEVSWGRILASQA